MVKAETSRVVDPTDVYHDVALIKEGLVSGSLNGGILETDHDHDEHGCNHLVSVEGSTVSSDDHCNADADASADAFADAAIDVVTFKVWGFSFLDSLCCKLIT